MFEEMLDEIVCESEYEVASAMFNAYCKYFTMEAYGTNADINIVFTEAETPKRETLLQKIIWFIPDLIMKFINFIKKKFGKLDEKPQEEIEHNVVANIQTMKQDKGKEKHVAAKLAAGGLALAATATGYVIHSKQKNKKVMSISVVDDTAEITIDSEFKNSINQINEMIPSTMAMVDELMKLYTTSDSSAYQKKYKSILKKINEENDKINKIRYSANEPVVTYTINELLTIIKNVEENFDKAEGYVNIIKNKPACTSTKNKYEQDTAELNKAIQDWIRNFNYILSDVSYMIESFGSTILFLDESPISGRKFLKDDANMDISFLKALVTYCSYKGSPTGFGFGAITDFNNNKYDVVPTSADKFEKLGKISKVIDKIMSGGDFVKPAWGCVSGDYFVSTSNFTHDGTWGVRQSGLGAFYTDTKGNYTAYSSFAFILNNADIFSRIADGTNSLSLSFSSKFFGGITRIGEKFIDDDNKGIFIDIIDLGQPLFRVRNSGKKLPDELMPGNDEIIIRLKNPEKTDELYNAFKGLGSDVKVTKIKSIPGGYFKIYLNGKK